MRRKRAKGVPWLWIGAAGMAMAAPTILQKTPATPTYHVGLAIAGNSLGLWLLRRHRTLQMVYGGLAVLYWIKRKPWAIDTSGPVGGSVLHAQA